MYSRSTLIKLAFLAALIVPQAIASSLEEEPEAAPAERIKPAVVAEPEIQPPAPRLAADHAEQRVPKRPAVVISEPEAGVVAFVTNSVSDQVHTAPIHLPPSAYIKGIPFSAQAPRGDWSMPWQEACEEMSLILVDYYLKGRSAISPEQAEAEIRLMLDWEDRYGYEVSETIARVGAIAENYYGYNTRLLHDVSVTSLQRELAAGKPVIVPTAGKLLNNPYYAGGGPWYHMLVVIGYDETGFITHDVGTLLGENYHYSYDVFMNAIHDWTGVPENIAHGKNVVLVVER